MEGDKICKNCQKPKAHHIYRWDLKNPWICVNTFFEEIMPDLETIKCDGKSCGAGEPHEFLQPKQAEKEGGV